MHEVNGTATEPFILTVDPVVCPGVTYINWVDNKYVPGLKIVKTDVPVGMKPVEPNEDTVVNVLVTGLVSLKVSELNLETRPTERFETCCWYATTSVEFVRLSGV